MMKCPNCGKINPNSYVCIYCGTSLNKSNSNDDVIDVTAERNDDTSSENINENTNQQHKYQKQYEQQNYQQDRMNQNNNYNSNQQNSNQQNSQQPQYKPRNKKNKAVTFILSFFLPGIGYCYIDKWAEGLIIFLIEVFLACIFWLLFPILISFIIWLYALVDSYNKTEQYNQGYLI